jgi:hypothetical protein
MAPQAYRSEKDAGAVSGRNINILPRFLHSRFKNTATNNS